MSEYVPGGQSMQREMPPEALKNVPGWQRVHTMDPVPSVSEPSVHGIQLSRESAPDVSEYVFFGHGMHAEEEFAASVNE
jgi:hypothetical protein